VGRKKGGHMFQANVLIERTPYRSYVQGVKVFAVKDSAKNTGYVIEFRGFEFGSVSAILSVSEEGDSVVIATGSLSKIPKGAEDIARVEGRFSGPCRLRLFTKINPTPLVAINPGLIRPTRPVIIT
jgi:hypothetical protein